MKLLHFQKCITSSSSPSSHYFSSLKRSSFDMTSQQDSSTFSTSPSSTSSKLAYCASFTMSNHICDAFSFVSNPLNLCPHSGHRLYNTPLLHPLPTSFMHSNFGITDGERPLEVFDHYLVFRFVNETVKHYPSIMHQQREDHSLVLWLD